MSQRIEGDVEEVSRPVPVLINRVLQSGVLTVGALICCLISSPRLTVLSGACLGPMCYLTTVSANWMSQLNNQMSACEEEANSTVTEALTNIRSVRAFSAEQSEVVRYTRTLAKLFGKMQKEAYGDLILENVEGCLSFCVSILVLIFGGLAIVEDHQEALTVGQLISFTMYWEIFGSGLEGIQDMFSELAMAAGAAQRVFDLLDISPDIPLADGPELRRDTFRGHIVFEDIHFTYQARPDKPVIKGLSLEIPAGGTCAFVGKSGAGKSTLMHLLLRFYDPQKGRILIDGIPLPDLNMRSLHDLTGFVSQETKLSYGTVKSNMTYGLPFQPSEDEINAALDEANCNEFVKDMEEGLSSKVGEGGIRLSGGQRQRLAIARAFLRRPRLLLLDEATSHLDAENESLVQASIDRLINGNKQGSQVSDCTVILIAHRLSTVRFADVIAVVSDGCIAEKGTHDELLQIEDGIYARLVAKQAERAANLLPEDVPSESGGGSSSGSHSGSSSGSRSRSSSSGSSSSSSSSRKRGPPKLTIKPKSQGQQNSSQKKTKREMELEKRVADLEAQLAEIAEEEETSGSKSAKKAKKKFGKKPKKLNKSNKDSKNCKGEKEKEIGKKEKEREEGESLSSEEESNEEESNNVSDEDKPDSPASASRPGASSGNRSGDEVTVKAKSKTRSSKK
eukprot:TRINITY_DN4402_c0_g6_i1.p1 TRINITY_DN4402_c0_g6~~TRINITY_DN4402_c0_g6_i1.p1  ORF type:complete len:678 (-),score=141.10 TRINITY_DN4402_c0_g6_i1:244-2277(-)